MGWVKSAFTHGLAFVAGYYIAGGFDSSLYRKHEGEQSPVGLEKRVGELENKIDFYEKMFKTYLKPKNEKGEEHDRK